MINNNSLLFLFGILISMNAGIVARVAIVNGDKAAVDQFPYQVSLIHNGQNVCGGGIISHEFILTAAHCLMSKDGKFHDIHISIRAGTNDLRRTTSPTVIANILKVYVLKDYLPDNPYKHGDIAVIKLKKRLKFSEHLDKLELPEHEESFVDKTALIAGFGRHWLRENDSKEKGGMYDMQLRFTEVDVFDYVRINQERHKLPDEVIHGKVKKIGHQKLRGVCSGDSGSPLVYGKNIIGILSRSSLDCLEREAGAAYTSVSHFLTFIHIAMNDIPHKDVRVHEFHQ